MENGKAPVMRDELKFCGGTSYTSKCHPFVVASTHLVVFLQEDTAQKQVSLRFNRDNLTKGNETDSERMVGVTNYYAEKDMKITEEPKRGSTK